MPFGLGVPELIIVLIIIVMIFGAGRLSQLGGSLGRAVHDFRSESGEATGPVTRDFEKRERE